MTTKNIFSNIPTHIENEIVELLAQNSAVMIERIISKGQRSPESGWYDQEKNEWVLVLKGEAILSFEDQPSVKLNTGGFINIPSRQKHKVAWTDPEKETIWLAIHY